MDAHARWLRRFVWSTVLQRGVRMALVAGVAGAALTLGATRDPWLAFPWGVILGQLFTVLMGWRAWTRAPLPGNDVFSFVDRRLVFRPAPMTELDDLGELIVRRDFQPVSLLGARLEDSPEDLGNPLVEVYQSDNHTVCAVRVHGDPPGWPFPESPTNPLVFLTQLSDGRILASAAIVQFPRRSLFLNPLPGHTPTGLLDDHRRSIDSLAKRGLRPLTAGPELAVDYLHQQQRALRDTGAAAGFIRGLAEAEPTRRVWRLRVDVPATELRRLALTTALDERLADERGG